jgi:hypothetical protein
MYDLGVFGWGNTAKSSSGKRTWVVLACVGSIGDASRAYFAT